MCGIVGFNWEDKKLIESMANEISHRGPDDYGFYTDKNISLGHRRLSIIDLSKNGRQPMFNETESILVIFNGEIYNYLRLKEKLKQEGHKFASNSDTEVIVHGYESYGDNICSMLEGMFAFALWDKKRKRLLIARDRIGKKPIYYYFKNKKLIFASEIKAILLDKEVKRDIDEQNLSNYLTLRYSSNDRTMFKDIKKLEPGRYMIFQDNKIEIKRHYSLPEIKERWPADEKRADELIEKAVKKRLMADVPIGVFLSGGLDSSAIVAYMARLGVKIKTFSIGFNHKTDETAYARIIADKFKTEHYEIKAEEDIIRYLPEVVWHFDEPLADPAALPTFVLAKEVSKKVKVALSGEGGDEVFGGYNPPNTLEFMRKYLFSKLYPLFFKKLSGNILKDLSYLFKYPKKQILLLAADIVKSENLSEAYKKLFYLPFDDKDKERILAENIKNKVDLKTEFDKYLSDENKLFENTYQYYFREWLPNDLLMKADKMSMAHGLEMRNPFLDSDLIEYFSGIRDEHKIKRELFRKVVGKILPDEIMKKKKQGFTLPISDWFTNEKFFDRIKEQFKDLEKRKILNSDELNRIVNNPRGFRNDHKLWVLLNLELWFKIYIDGISYDKIKI